MARNTSENEIKILYESIFGGKYAPGYWDADSRNQSMQLLWLENSCQDIAKLIDNLRDSQRDAHEDMFEALRGEVHSLKTLVNEPKFRAMLNSLG